MITLIVIFVIIGILAGIKETCKIISKLILLCVGFIIVCALLSTAFVVLKVVVKIALAALCLFIIAGFIRRLSLK